ncbi:ZIP family metal transporter [Maribacter sp. ACAM166]|uniref:ZIP family metal transporter n=1 Tax=Maribacter sp. ACAM166 TaxID=2508996 RepID=UPI0010FF5695|nr:ZIP family zinc transporter [Maribacter sp. ACAM166]TLP70607.1 ZIP family zinc transporter [Maribacter sp. ACAM166]
MNPQLEATFWGLITGSALLIGALGGYYLKLTQGWIAIIMAFGSGVLISVLSFDLMDEAFQTGGIEASSIGFLIGALIYTGANVILAKMGARHRKRSGAEVRQDEEDNGIAIAMGALLDGIPESIAIGLSLLTSPGVSLVAVIGIFLSNIPEGLSSTTGMKKSGKSKTYIFGLWLGITVISGISAWAGYTLFDNVSPSITAGTTALAAGAVLAMVLDTMIPEAFQKTRSATGLIAVIGFLCAFYLSKSLVE